MDQYLVAVSSGDTLDYIYAQADGFTALFLSTDDGWTVEETFSESYDSPSHVMYGQVPGYPGSLSWYTWCDQGECLDHSLYYDGETDGATCLRDLGYNYVIIYDEGCSRQVQDFPFLTSPAPLQIAEIVIKNGQTLLDTQVAPHWHLLRRATGDSGGLGLPRGHFKSSGSPYELEQAPRYGWGLHSPSWAIRTGLFSAH